MRNLLYPLLAMLAGIYLCGCNSDESQPSSATTESGTVAVVDLDHLARSLGRDIEMVDSIKQAAGQLNSQLKVIQAQWEEEISDKKSEFGEEEELTDEQSQTLLKMQTVGNLKLNQLRQQAQAKLRGHQLGLVKRYQDDIRPIAEEIAKEKGFSVVISKNQAVLLTFDDSVDITEEVGKRLSE